MWCLLIEALCLLPEFPCPINKSELDFCVWLRLNGLLRMMSAFIFGTNACLQPAEQNTMAKKKKKKRADNNKRKTKHKTPPKKKKYERKNEAEGKPKKPQNMPKIILK